MKKWTVVDENALLQLISLEMEHSGYSEEKAVQIAKEVFESDMGFDQKETEKKWNELKKKRCLKCKRWITDKKEYGGICGSCYESKNNRRIFTTKIATVLIVSYLFIYSFISIATKNGIPYKIITSCTDHYLLYPPYIQTIIVMFILIIGIGAAISVIEIIGYEAYLTKRAKWFYDTIFWLTSKHKRANIKYKNDKLKGLTKTNSNQ